MGEGAASPLFVGPRMKKGQFTEDMDGILAALLALISGGDGGRKGIPIMTCQVN